VLVLSVLDWSGFRLDDINFSELEAGECVIVGCWLDSTVNDGFWLLDGGAASEQIL